MGGSVCVCLFAKVLLPLHYKTTIMLQELRDRGIDLSKGISVSTDTRNLPAGCIFFALKGETFNGNKFAQQAIEQGAALAVIDEATYVSDHTLLVDDCLLALQSLAREWREQWGKPIIGITGTNGKTTTKELMAAVLKTRYHLHYTQGNLNNQIGVPLTLLQLRPEHELAIIEMGASHPGDIQELVEIAEPNCGLITNVGKAHLLGFGSFEGVKRTKAELYDYLHKDKSAFIFRNIDNLHLAEMAGDLPYGSYALHNTNADLIGKVTDCDAFLQMEVSYLGETLAVHTQIVGAYNAENVLAAIRVGLHFGVTLREAVAAIEAYIPTNNRSMLRKTDRNSLVIDVYNANATSMQAAVLNFTQMRVPMEDKCLILGDMRELGEESHLEHQNIVNLLEEQRFEQVWLVGSEFQATTAVYPTFADVEAATAYFCEHPLTGKHILLKGSHGVHLERLIDLF